MKKHLLTSLALGLLCLGASLVPARAQVILNPNIISGTIRFTNVNPAILSLLKAPNNEGMSNIIVLASSLPPAPAISANSGYLPVNTRTGTVYQVTVDSDNPGIEYALYPRVVMQGQAYTYFFAGQTSAPVVIGVTPPPVDFDECVGVVTVQFVTSGGAPLAVDGGIITAFSLPDGNYSGQRSDIPAGVSEQRIYLRGDATHRIEITVHRGTSYYTNRIESFLSTNVAVVCDQFQTISMVLPNAGTLAQIAGNVDVLREFEITSPANPAYDFLADHTSVIANSGPFSNQRWDRLPGVNFTTPSSGPFVLTNVVPSTLDPASLGYAVYAQMMFRTNRNIQILQTPALGSGLNPALPVTAGATISLSNLFVIDPGYLRGRVLLQGPAESLGRPSLLRGLTRASDDDLNGDGIPDAIGTYGIYGTTIQAIGVDRLAPGANFSASSGLSYGEFPGNFNPTNSAYEGQYELVLGGLNSEPTIWKQKYLTLSLSSGTVTNDDDYFFNSYTITEESTNDVEIIPTQPSIHDVAYCLSELKVVFRSTSGTFYNPGVGYPSGGTFTNTDFLGHPANYSVALSTTAGIPSTEAAATNIGQVVMYLPQGTYTLYPSVSASGGGQTGLQPIDVTVGCGQRLTIEPCLQVILNTPTCTNSLVRLTGSVQSCTNNVTSLSYTLDGGPPQTICNNCGINPSYAFNVNLTGECNNHTLIVTATDANGGVSSITTAIHYDTTPPVIQCPTNIVATACDTNGTAVNFNVTATDNCAGAVLIVCNPPSGSLFPPGSTTVNCVATDACGNTSNCSFPVTVNSSELSIERAVIITWACGGTLQYADDLTGPWFDIPSATSPYCVAATAAKRFYRTRN